MAPPTVLSSTPPIEPAATINLKSKSITTSKFNSNLYSNDNLDSKADLINQAGKFIESQTYDDWRQDFLDNGFAIVKSVIPRERAIKYQQDMFDYLKALRPNLDVNDSSTWIKENLPVHSPRNLYYYYSASHEKFLWDIRTEQGVIDAFAKLWNTDELLVSFDAFNVTFPNRTDKPRLDGWQHVDQSPFKKNLSCAQGIVNLSNCQENDGGLVVYKGTHKLLQTFFETQTDSKDWTTIDSYPLTNDQLQWFLDQGCEKIKINAEPGDLILWDSRTIHWGSEPNELGNTIRSISYVSYSPKCFASESSLKTKRDVFNQWLGTTHWAHDNIIARRLEAKLDDGSIDPKDRQEPINKPILTGKLKKLAGLVDY